MEDKGEGAGRISAFYSISHTNTFICLISDQIEKNRAIIPSNVNSCPWSGRKARNPPIPNVAKRGPIKIAPQALHPTPKIPAIKPASPFPKTRFMPDVLRWRI